MATKKVIKKVDKKDTQLPQTKNYKRGNLMGNMREYFRKFYEKDGNFNNAKYEDAEKLAKSIMPTTKFNKYHFSWYKNTFFTEFSNAKKEASKK
jgi:hypothetical protein